MATYRCYLFDDSHNVDQVIDFGAATDADACAEADNIGTGFQYDQLELWGSGGMIYSLARQSP